ncbi:hypothetical protein BGZ73_004040 [Actinomortierella ambigua]|nr:hypothetical protein BGZ73_004040 [Actinomortierella ambigua]
MSSAPFTRSSQDLRPSQAAESSKQPTHELPQSSRAKSLSHDSREDGEDIDGNDTLLESDLTYEEEKAFLGRYRWKTSYAAAFEVALDTVVPGEAHLFSDEELSVFDAYSALPDDSKYLMRAQLIETIMNHFRQQSFISKRLLIKNTNPHGNEAKAIEGPFYPRPRELVAHSFDNDSKRHKALITKIVKISGPCLKICPQILKIFLRLHLVFLRSREYSEKPALVQAILARIGQRNYPPYEVKRSTTVFRNREELIKYEEALYAEHQLEKMVVAAAGPGSGTSVFVKDADHDNVDPYLLAAKAKAKGAARPKDRKQESTEILEAVVEKAEKFRELWRQYVASEQSMGDGVTINYYMLRFSPGWIYTRILRTELKALATLKRFQEEAFLLMELLDQKVYCLDTRGAWYDRLALIKSNYTYDKRLGKQEALQVCMQALRDKHVHAADITAAIQARIVRLESELRVPFRDRHDFSYLELREAHKRVLTGERLNRPGTAAPGYASSHSYAYLIPDASGIMGIPEIQQRPLWLKSDGSAVSVEELALNFYETLGYRGFHSENAILLTLFGLLFWDILFTPMEGVFETAYQTAPLDLNTDAFYVTRQGMIEERVQLIAQSTLLSEDQIDERLVNMLEENEENLSEEADVAVNEVPVDVTNLKSEMREDDREEKVTVISSESFEEDRLRARRLAVKRQACFYLDLLNRVDDEFRARKVLCVGGMLSQQYASIWLKVMDYVAQECQIFVKGPGDRLSSKQKVWIDLLSSVGVDVELCLVEASTAEEEFEEERRLMN